MSQLSHRSKFGQKPFALGSVHGIRAFKPNKFTGNLHAVHAEYIWKPGENISFCLNMMPWMQGHHAPRIGCTCGFYAYYNGKNEYHAPPATVAGVIEGYGSCIIGDWGFQAGKAKIVGLIFPKRRRGFELNMLTIEPWFVGIWTGWMNWLAIRRLQSDFDGFWDYAVASLSVFTAIVAWAWLLICVIAVWHQEQRIFPTFRADKKLHRKIAKQYPDAKIFRTDEEAVEYFNIKTVYPVKPPRGRYI